MSASEKRHLSVLVALHSGSLSGVDSYAEQIAVAGAEASHDVTLIGLGAEVAAELNRRVGRARIRVLATEPLTRSGWRPAARQVPTFALAEMHAHLEGRLAELAERFDVAHLNHPALASAVRRFADRVVVGAWFYPHRPLERVAETWRHTGASFPKSAGFAIKGLSHYWNDRRGYLASDCVVAPTELLAAQLEAIGVHAVACPPPGALPERALDAGDSNDQDEDGARRITICCGDLAHPRKSVRAGIRAVGLLAGTGMKIALELIGRNAGALAASLNALPPSVTVLTPGPLPRDEVHARLRRANILLVPSLYEEWGYVATEAALAGTPVVAFPVYPFVEILAPPLGVCARDMSPEALANALAQALDGDAGRSFVAAAAERRFGAEAVGQRLSKIWSGTAAGAGDSVPADGRLVKA